MKFVVLNGSPKGNQSLTLQYARFIQEKNPEHQFEIFNVCQEIAKIEKDPKTFQKIIEIVKASHGVLWTFPLYFLLVHSGYKKFIELIWEHGVQGSFKGKYAASISTSINFFDHTAHNYINGICDDLGMKYLGAFSAEMNDLLKPAQREKLTLFADHFFQAVETKAPTARNYPPLIDKGAGYIPGPAPLQIDLGGKKVLVITDAENKDINLQNMVQQFKASLVSGVEIVDLHDLDIKGGCLGCMHCGYDNTCVYEGKDAYINFFNTKVKKADILVFAGAIKDRYLSSRWKLFFDRSFFNGHAPYLVGKQLGFIVSGPLLQIPNLRQILEAYSQIEGAGLVEFVTDEAPDSADTDALLQYLAARLVQYAKEGYFKPQTFLGIGGHKILRDATWGRLRPSFVADFRYFQRHRMYDFPQKDIKTRMMVDALTTLLKVPGFRKEFAKRTIPEMVKPAQNVVAKTQSAARTTGRKP
jgi:multimeric flavodoxin WrbA